MIQNLDAAISVVMLITAGAGGWFAGRRGARSGPLAEAASTVTILLGEVDVLKLRLTERDQQLAEMRGRILTLEDLVTQRADVQGVREVVDRIAEKVGA